MPAKRNLLGKPRKLWGLCKAPACSPDVATHKTGYCDFHHAEYAIAKQRYDDMKYNFTAGRSSRVPPDFKDYCAEISFTQISEVTGSFDERVIEVIKGALNDTARAQDMAARHVEVDLQLTKTLSQIERTLRILIELQNDDPLPLTNENDSS